MWVADTSWLYALFRGDDAHHATARREAAEPVPVFINPATLVEFLDLLRERSGHAESLAALAALMATPTVRLVGPSKPAMMARVVAAHSRLSWQDAAAICTALDEGAGLRTFDKTQRKAFEAMA